MSHKTSAAVRARAWYSDSQLERETIGCFLALQETRLLLIKIEEPKVERLVSGQPTQSASEYATKPIIEDEVNLRPK